MHDVGMVRGTQDRVGIVLARIFRYYGRVWERGGVAVLSLDVARRKEKYDAYEDRWMDYGVLWGYFLKNSSNHPTPLLSVIPVESGSLLCLQDLVCTFGYVAHSRVFFAKVWKLFHRRSLKKGIKRSL